MIGCSAVINKLINLERLSIKVFGQESFKMIIMEYLDLKVILTVRREKVKNIQIKIGQIWLAKKVMI
jgi:hypothetical protein